MRSLTQSILACLPLFITYDIYLTSGGCCIGGYHSANGAQPGGQTYSYATYVDSAGAFSQDVSRSLMNSANGSMIPLSTIA